MVSQTSEAVDILVEIWNIMQDQRFWRLKDIVEDEPARRELYRTLGPHQNHRVINGRAYYHLPGVKKLRICEILTLDDNGKAHNLSIRFIDAAEELPYYSDIIFIESWTHLWEDKPNSTYYYDPVDCVCVYISEKDIWNGGNSVYRAGFPYAQNDLECRVSCPSLFINAEVDDESEIAALMQKITGRSSSSNTTDSISKRLALTNPLFSPEVTDQDYARLCKKAFNLLSPLYHYELNAVIEQLDISQEFRNLLKGMLEGAYVDAWKQKWKQDGSN